MKLRFLFYFVFFLSFLSSCGTYKQIFPKYSNKEVGKIINYAGKFTGVPYKYGGNTPKGFDCSGFTQYVFNEFNHRLPRSTSEQSQTGIEVNKNHIQPGDLVFFMGSNTRNKSVGHVGIVIDSNKKGYFLFIHASSSGVTVSSSLENYYKKRYLLARRIIP